MNLRAFAAVELVGLGAGIIAYQFAVYPTLLAALVVHLSACVAFLPDWASRKAR